MSGAETLQLVPTRIAELEFLFPEIADFKSLIAFETKSVPNPFREGDGIWLLHMNGQEEKVDIFQFGQKERTVPKDLVLRAENLKIEWFLNETEKLIDKLGAGNGVWIFEHLDGSFLDGRGNLVFDQKDLREETLKNWGLVARKVVMIRGTDFALWYGRKEKKRQTQGVDLSKKDYFHWMLNNLRRDLGKGGWVEVDTSEIEGNCRESHFPPNDLNNLKLGFGVEVRSPCGCQWHVHLDGEWERKSICEPECEGIPKPKEGKLKGLKGKVKENPGPICAEHGTKMTWNSKEHCFVCGSCGSN